jgi:hypothetical protein
VSLILDVRVPICTPTSTSIVATICDEMNWKEKSLAYYKETNSCRRQFVRDPEDSSLLPLASLCRRRSQRVHSGPTCRRLGWTRRLGRACLLVRPMSVAGVLTPCRLVVVGENAGGRRRLRRSTAMWLMIGLDFEILWSRSRSSSIRVDRLVQLGAEGTSSIYSGQWGMRCTSSR